LQPIIDFQKQTILTYLVKTLEVSGVASEKSGKDTVWISLYQEPGNCGYSRLMETVDNSRVTLHIVPCCLG